MKLFLLCLSLIAFVIAAIFALAGGTLGTVDHLFATVSIGLALLAASFLPIPNG